MRGWIRVSEMKIDGERIELRMLGIEELASWLEDEDSFTETFGMDVVEGLLNKRLQEVFRLKLDKMKSDPENLLWYTYFAIMRKDSDQMIGLIGFKDAPDGHGMSEIGYGIGSSFRGQGYATEAVRILSEWVFDNTHVKSIFAQTDINNIPSGKVLEKVGFSMERQDGKMFQWKLEKEASPSLN
jgi:RimJ/RimL family protein N-acetyltransferase